MVETTNPAGAAAVEEAKEPLVMMSDYDENSDDENDAEVSDDGMDKLEAFMSGAVNAKMVLSENKAFNAAPLQLAKKISSAN